MCLRKLLRPVGPLQTQDFMSKLQDSNVLVCTMSICRDWLITTTATVPIFFFRQYRAGICIL